MIPAEMDRLNNLVREGAMQGAVLFSILGDMPSGPLDFVTSRTANISHTSESVQRSSSGQVEESISGVGWCWIGGCDLLKQEQKNEFNRLAQNWPLYYPEIE